MLSRNKIWLRKRALFVDIDDTLCHTCLQWFEEFVKMFGGDKTALQLRLEYNSIWDVPGWKEMHSDPRIDTFLHSDDFHQNIPAVLGAAEILHSFVNTVMPIEYLTARPFSVQTATEDWLKRNMFPIAPVITRPMRVPLENRYVWKALYTEGSFPRVLGILEDDIRFVEALSSSYPGVVYFIGHSVSPRNDIRVIPCPTISDFERESRRFDYRILKAS